MTTPGTTGDRTGRARALLVRASGLERVIWSSIGRAIARKPAIPSGATGFGYHRSTLVLLVVFVIMSAVEVVVIDLIVHRWLWLRVPLLVLGVWGLAWVVGLLCAHLVRPHTVGPDGIHVRDGMDLDAHVSWDDVYSVAIRKHIHQPKTPRVIGDQESASLVVDVADQTNLEIELERPTPIAVPGIPPQGGERAVTTIRLWADDPKGFLAEVGKHI